MRSLKTKNSFKILRKNEYIWSLEGVNQETLIATLVKTKNLDVKIINLKSLHESNVLI